MKQKNEETLLLKLVGAYTELHRMPLGWLGSHDDNRILSLWWKHVKVNGFPGLANGRTDRRTIEELVEDELLEGHGSTSSRGYSLTVKGIFTAWALNGDTPSFLEDVMRQIEEAVEKNVVTFEKDVPAFPFHRDTGFPPAFTALELLGLIKIGFVVAYTDPADAYYSVLPTGKQFAFPSDKSFPAADQPDGEPFNAGKELANMIAATPLPKQYRCELGGLDVFKIKTFASEELERDFKNAKGLFEILF